MAAVSHEDEYSCERCSATCEDLPTDDPRTWFPQALGGYSSTAGRIKKRMLYLFEMMGLDYKAPDDPYDPSKSEWQTQMYFGDKGIKYTPDTFPLGGYLRSWVEAFEATDWMQQGPHKVNDVRLSLKFFTAYHQYFHGDSRGVGGRQVCVDAEAPNDICEDGGYAGNSTIATGNATEQRLPLGYDCSDCFKDRKSVV